MNTIFALMAVLSVLSVSKSYAAEYNTFTTCVRDYVKQGCYKEGRTAMDLIISDRDSQGIELNWKKFKESIHSLACRCSTKAKANNYTYFSIRYYAECWAGKDLMQMERVIADRTAMADNCINHEFQKCLQAHLRECVGAANHEYFYTMPIDGGYTQWSVWSSCNVTCGPGVRTRDRYCADPIPSRGGKPCQGHSSETKKCDTTACPVDGGFSVWSPWFPCTASCTQKRVRHCTNPVPLHGGKNCTGIWEDSKICNTSACTGGPKPTVPIGGCVKTTGGNAKGACCKFPFTYKNKQYTKCTTVNHNRFWCATKSNYGKYKLWGNCPVKGGTCPGQKTSISCKSPKRIRIIGVSYGKDLASICKKRGIMGIKKCSSKNSVAQIMKLCNKKYNCVLEKKNGTFPDSCYGTYKYLAVRFKCA